MITRTAAVALLVMLLSVAGLSWAGDGVLNELDKRDKLYDIVEWGNEHWVVGYAGNLLISADKGKSWQRKPFSLKQAIFAMDVFDKDHAVLCGPDGLLMHSADHGATWTQVEIETKNPLFDVAAAKGSSHAWSVGHFNTIFHSADFGKTWTRQEYKLPEDAVDEPGLNAVFFLDEKTGWIAGEFGTLLSTVDGGENWTRLTSPTQYNLFDVVFLDTMRGAVVGSEGDIFTTEDGGATWAKKILDTRVNLYSLSIVGNTLHAVGQDGYHVWGPLFGEGKYSFARTGVFNWLNAVHFMSETTGLAAGGRGSIMLTVDGGKSWQQLSGR